MLAGFPLADPLVGVLITLAILVVLRGAATDVYRRLMDAVDPALTDQAEQCLAGTPGVRDVESVRLRWIGHRMLAEVAITVDETMTLGQAHDVATEAHHRLLHDVPKLVEATIHVSPCDAAGRVDHEVIERHFGRDD